MKLLWFINIIFIGMRITAIKLMHYDEFPHPPTISLALFARGRSKGPDGRAVVQCFDNKVES